MVIYCHLKAINQYIAKTKNKDPNYLVVARLELNRRKIDYSAINYWFEVDDWKKVVFYKLNGQKIIKPAR